MSRRPPPQAVSRKQKNLSKIVGAPATEEEDYGAKRVVSLECPAES
jgi:hypothetical protein